MNAEWRYSLKTVAAEVAQAFLHAARCYRAYRVEVQTATDEVQRGIARQLANHYKAERDLLRGILHQGRRS